MSTADHSHRDMSQHETRTELGLSLALWRKHLDTKWIHNIRDLLVANTIYTARCVPVSFYIHKNICT